VPQRSYSQISRRSRHARRAIRESADGTIRHPNVVNTMNPHATRMKAMEVSRCVPATRNSMPIATPMTAVAPSRNEACDRDVHKRSSEPPDGEGPDNDEEPTGATVDTMTLAAEQDKDAKADRVEDRGDGHEVSPGGHTRQLTGADVRGPRTSCLPPSGREDHDRS
jgi:hypothetical protein